MNSWHILAPLAFIAGLVLLLLAALLDRRKQWPRQNNNEPVYDERDWYGQFMKDCKDNPRSWR